MLMLETTRIIASKYGGKHGGTSTIFDVATNTEATLTFTIPRGYVFYLIEFGGNGQNTDLNVQVRNAQNLVLQEYDEFPDSFIIISYLPFLQEYFKGNINVKFNNTNASTQTVTFILNGILIPENIREDFEKELKQCVSGVF